MKRYLVGEHFYNRNETFAGIVYYIKNKVNGKGYVGQTTLPMNLRWNVHISDARNGHDNLFSRAINKYGESNFEVNIIAYCKTQIELDAVEAGFIRGFGTLASLGSGYNVIEGSNHSGRKTQCKRGHSLLDPGNVHIDGSGCRRCYICLKANRRRSRFTPAGIEKAKRHQARRKYSAGWYDYHSLYNAKHRAKKKLIKGLPLSDLEKEALKSVVGSSTGKSLL